jgi:hypothetical protein
VRVSGYEGVPSWYVPRTVCGTTNVQQECMTKYTDSEYLSILCKRVWDLVLGKVDCVFHIMRCQYTTLYCDEPVETID